MTATTSLDHNNGISLRQAALLSGFGMLVMAVATPFAEFYVYPRVVAGRVDQISERIIANHPVISRESWASC